MSNSSSSSPAESSMELTMEKGNSSSEEDDLWPFPHPQEYYEADCGPRVMEIEEFSDSLSRCSSMSTVESELDSFEESVRMLLQIRNELLAKMTHLVDHEDRVKSWAAKVEKLIRVAEKRDGQGNLFMRIAQGGSIFAADPSKLQQSILKLQDQGKELIILGSLTGKGTIRFPKKIVVKLGYRNNRSVSKKAIKSVSSLSGVRSITLHQDEQKLTVVGNFDALKLLEKVRKVCPAYLVLEGGSHSKLPSAELRLMSDLEGINKEPPEGCRASPLTDENLFEWSATVIGPDKTPWEGGVFGLRLTFGDNYPEKPPLVEFTSEVFHPNVYSNGLLRMDILEDAWSPCHNVCSILTSIQSLFTDPNPANPANPEAAHLFQHDIQAYNTRVRRCVCESIEILTGG